MLRYETISRGTRYRHKADNSDAIAPQSNLMDRLGDIARSRSSDHAQRQINQLILLIMTALEMNEVGYLMLRLNSDLIYVDINR